jgi:NAD(P)-dependent dehydrogenase (short-subunit alcohol dehydrogenase family)
VIGSSAGGALDGRSALVTGGAAGIGRAVVARLLAEGAAVTVADLRADALDELVADLGTNGLQVVQGDLSLEADVERVVSAAVERFGQLDLVHSNAGVIGSIGPIATTSADDFDRTVAHNLRSTFLVLSASARQMIEQGEGGAIVSTSSGAGLRGFAGIGPYAAAKHGVIGLVRTAAVELADHGIRVNAVCPFNVRTRMSEEFAVDDSAPQRRMGEPDEVANLVCWLLSPEATYVNGVAYELDGGFLAGFAA